MKNAILFILLVVIIILLCFRGGNDIIHTKIIQGKTDTVEIYKIKTVEKLKIVNRLHTSTDTIRIYLDSVITLKDTVRIIEVQSILIDTLTEENKQLYKVVELQDSTIVMQSEIIALKDKKIKKVKRRLVGSVVLNIIQSALIIFRK